MDHKIPTHIMLNSQICDEQGQVKDLAKDQEALHSYLNQHVQPNLCHFERLSQKLAYLTQNNYYESAFLQQYTPSQIKELFQLAYSFNFQFKSYTAAFKFYSDYALKNSQGQYIESYEDKLSIIALYHADGDLELAKMLLRHLIQQDFIPATPIMLNTARANRGEYVSCFLLEMDDDLNSIMRVLEQAANHSKRGGGVAINFSNLRARGEDIKNLPGVCKGMVGFAKMFDVMFRTVDQMGQRPGAGAIYLSILHADIEELLGAKKINADDDARLTTLSVGVIVPDIFLRKLKAGQEIYLFYPGSIKKAYGLDFADVTAQMDLWYDRLVANPQVKKRKINPLTLMNTITNVQIQSGYPYLLFIDNANKASAVPGLIKHSNLCTEILQPSTKTISLTLDQVKKETYGLDVSCILASGHIENMLAHNSIEATINSAQTILNSVSNKTNLAFSPSIAQANALNRSIGFGMMGLHGLFAKHFINYGDPDAIDLVDVFFNIVNFYSLKHSMLTAKTTQQTFHNFAQSHYADGSYFTNKGAIYPQTNKVKAIFKNINIPTDAQWAELKQQVMRYGLYNSHRLAIAPNGSTAYLMSATPGVTPIKSLVEQRQYGNQKTFYPAPHLENDKVRCFYTTAYSTPNKDLINTLAVIQKHIDQGISFELCIPKNYDLSKLLKTHVYAHLKGLKTLYYVRTTTQDIHECLSCQV